MSETPDPTLVTLASYASEVEASLAQQILAEAGIPARLGQTASATWMWHVGTALGGVQLLVRDGDRTKAAAVLNDRADAIAADEVHELGADEPLSDSASTEPDELELPPELRRAYRSAFISLIFIPFFVCLYSIWLIFRHQLWRPERGGNTIEFYLTLAMCVFNFFLGTLVWRGW